MRKVEPPAAPQLGAASAGLGLRSAAAHAPAAYTASVSGTWQLCCDLDADYHAWGHSMLVDPWGDVLAEAGDVEQLIVHDINLERMKEIRTNIPISMQRREQFY